MMDNQELSVKRLIDIKDSASQYYPAYMTKKDKEKNMLNIEKTFIEFAFSNINPNKLSFSFTWDDNFERHIKYIAPIFDKYHKKCTFYINPGEPDFKGQLQSGYNMLAHRGFEIGSHGYTHHHFSHLSSYDYSCQLIKSRELIGLLLGTSPVTFAFPHHDYTPEMLEQAKTIYFETRNTLNNSQRFSLKSYTTSSEIQSVVQNAISSGRSIVFSGHSIRLNSINDIIDGYEPVSIDVLNDAISIILKNHVIAEICTFCQAALKTYIKTNCVYTNEAVSISKEQIAYLKRFGLTPRRIEELI